MAHPRAKPKATKGRQPQDQKKRGRGRPTDFRAEYCEQVEKLCLLGATDEQIADFFGKAPSTVALWKLKHPEFSEAIKAGKIVADMDTAASLHRRTKVFEFDEQQAIKVKEVTYGGDGKRLREVERVEVVTVRRTLPPDPVSCFFWLKNRRKDAWRDRQDHSHEGKLDVNLDEVRETLQGKLARIAAASAAKPVPGKPQ